MKFKFSIRFLLAMVVAFAITCTCALTAVEIAAISCAFTFGPIIPYSSRRTCGAIVAGILAAAFWVAIASASTACLFMHYEIEVGRGIVLHYSPWILAVAVIASCIGGYLAALVLRQNPKSAMET